MAGNYDTHRILAQDHLVSNNTWETGLNNNDLIIGPSGSGKTRNYVKPNLLQCALEKGCSLIVADAKGSLVKEVGPVLAAHGYKVINLDFIKLLSNTCGYNPLAFIEYDPELKKYSEQDILTLASCLCPVENQRDPYWDKSAQTYLAAVVAYVMETLPEEEHTLEAVLRLYKNLDRTTANRNVTVGDRLFGELEEEHPNSFACQKYWEATAGRASERTYASTKAILNGHLGPLGFDGAKHLFRLKESIDFQSLGRELTAVFLTISDIDRSMDKLTNLFYTQALNKLLLSADRDYPDNRLPVPVRFILDDFATNVVIPDFDKLSSNVRSREIYLSVILQSVTQLYSIYDEFRGSTIINNCDSCLYLGGQDVRTASTISSRAGRTMDSILHMPRGEMWLMTGSDRAVKASKYDLTSHPLYHELPEAGNVFPSQSNAKKIKIDLEQSACPVLDKHIEWAVSDNRDEEPDSDLFEYAEQEFIDNREPDFAPSPSEDELDEILDDLSAARAFDMRELPEYDTDEQGNPLLDKRGILKLLMSEDQLDSLRSRRKQLANKAAQLELILSGRGELVLPWITDGAGHYSERALWALIDELAGDDELVGMDAKETALVALERSFFYCALRLASNPPRCLVELAGTFGDVLWAAQDAAKAEELRAPDGFIRWMDELYEIVTGGSVNDDLLDSYPRESPDFAPDPTDENEIAEILEAERVKLSYQYAEAYDGPLNDEGNPIIDEDEARREQERKDWAQSLPAPVIFSQQYLQLRRLLLKDAARKQLAQAVETALDRFLYEHQISRWMDDNAYSCVCGLLAEMMEKVQAQLDSLDDMPE